MQHHKCIDGQSFTWFKFPSCLTCPHTQPEAIHMSALLGHSTEAAVTHPLHKDTSRHGHAPTADSTAQAAADLRHPLPQHPGRARGRGRGSAAVYPTVELGALSLMARLENSPVLCAYGLVRCEMMYCRLHCCCWAGMRYRSGQQRGGVLVQRL